MRVLLALLLALLRPVAADYVLVQSNATASPPSGQYGTTSATVLVGGFISGIDQDALVYAPSTPGKYPLITFAHGVFYGGVSTEFYYGRILVSPSSRTPERHPSLFTVFM